MALASILLFSNTFNWVRTWPQGPRCCAQKLLCLTKVVFQLGNLPPCPPTHRNYDNEQKPADQQWAACENKRISFHKPPEKTPNTYGLRSTRVFVHILVDTAPAGPCIGFNVPISVARISFLSKRPSKGHQFLVNLSLANKAQRRISSAADKLRPA